MKNRKNFFSAITFVIAMLLIASTSTFAVGDNDDEGININKLDLNLQSIEKKIDVKNIESYRIGGMMGHPEFTLFDDQLHPDFSVNQDLNYLASFRDRSYETLIFTHTPNDGVYFNIVGGDYPCIKQRDNGEFYGTFVPDPTDSYGGIMYLFKTNQPTNFESYQLSGWDWSTFPDYPGEIFWNDIIDIELACDPYGEDWDWGFISMVSDTNYGDEPLEKAPFVSHQTDETGNATMSWYQIDGCKHTDNVIDHKTYEAFSAYDWYNSDDDRWEILIRIDHYDNWNIQPSLYEYYDTNADYKYPAITSYDGNIVAVFETDENENKDIKCLYGNSLGDLEESFVIQTNSDERYPNVEYISENTFICTYTKDGNYYGCLSEDSGETWSEPWMINDESDAVISEYKFSDLTDGGKYTLWEEQGFEDIDIYIGPSANNDDPDAPVINAPSKVSTGEEVEYGFTVQDEEGEDIFLYINWGDGEIDQWIGPYSSNEEIKITHTYASDGEYEIKAKAKDINDYFSKWSQKSVSSPITNINLINPRPGTIYSDFTGSDGLNLRFLLGKMILFLQKDITVTAEISNVDMLEFNLKEISGQIIESKQITSHTDRYSHNFGRPGIGFYEIEANAYKNNDLYLTNTLRNILCIST